MKPKEPPPLAHLLVSGQLRKDAEAHQRFIAACFALVAILGGRGPDEGVNHDDIGFAVECADTLLEVLKDTA